MYALPAFPPCMETWSTLLCFHTLYLGLGSLADHTSLCTTDCIGIIIPSQLKYYLFYHTCLHTKIHDIKHPSKQKGGHSIFFISSRANVRNFSRLIILLPSWSVIPPVR